MMYGCVVQSPLIREQRLFQRSFVNSNSLGRWWEQGKGFRTFFRFVVNGDSLGRCWEQDTAAFSELSSIVIVSVNGGSGEQRESFFQNFCQ